MPSRNTDPALLPAQVVSDEIGAGRLSPVDLVEAELKRIEAADGKLHAFVEVYDKEARLAAEAADKAIRSGHRVGPLHGIPIALKDLIEIEGRVTTGGSQVWRERRSAYTATLAQKLIAAGLIVIGKTHTVEFAMGGWGTNQRPRRRAHPGRVEQRLGGGGRGRVCAVGDRHRHRRLGAAAGIVVRPCRIEDDDRPGQHLWHPPARPDPRHARADGPFSY
jgi:aspartyl-tRNA(Asn)/glutamyl-tRNA(Gln) amidotransferase subunit A